jgi:hypothetical protein
VTTKFEACSSCWPYISAPNELLDLSYENRLARYMDALAVDVDVYGLSLFGDGATVHGMPLMNIL